MYLIKPYVALNSANCSLSVLDFGHCQTSQQGHGSRKSINWETQGRLRNCPIWGARIEKEIICHTTFTFITVFPPFNSVKGIIKNRIEQLLGSGTLFVNKWKRKSLKSFFFNLSNLNKGNCFSCEVPKFKYYSTEIH